MFKRCSNTSYVIIVKQGCLVLWVNDCNNLHTFVYDIYYLTGGFGAD